MDKRDDPARAQPLASIAGVSIHALLVPFPLVLLTAALVCDLAFWSTGNASWGTASLWMIDGGLAAGLLAGLVGFADFAALEEPAGRSGFAHLLGALLVIGLAAANALLRKFDHIGAILPGGLGLSAVTTAVLVVTAWAGLALARKDSH